jgi:hypothetical protein
MRRQVFDGMSQREPAEIKSVTSAQTGPHSRCGTETHQLRVSKGPAACFRPTDGSRHTRMDAGVRRGRGRGVSVWRDEKERKKRRGGASYEVMHSSLRTDFKRCVHFLTRNTRQANNETLISRRMNLALRDLDGLHIATYSIARVVLNITLTSE